MSTAPLLPAPVLDVVLVAEIEGITECEQRATSPHRAEFTALCRQGCGTSLMLCGRHLRSLRQRIVELAVGGNRYGCVECLTVCGTFDEAFQVDPL